MVARSASAADGCANIAEATYANNASANQPKTFRISRYEPSVCMIKINSAIATVIPVTGTGRNSRSDAAMAPISAPASTTFAISKLKTIECKTQRG